MNMPPCECGCGMSVLISTRTNLPNRFIVGHYKRTKRPTYSVDDQSGCWNWLGFVGKDGYAGKVTDQCGRMVPAYRFFFERIHGAVPGGLQLDHLCRNRRCVNPDHLEPVTPAENVRRRSTAKLSGRLSKVKELLASGMLQKQVAIVFSVDQSAISHLLRREKAGHVSL